MDGKRKALYYGAIAIAVLIGVSVVVDPWSLAIGVTVWMVTGIDPTRRAGRSCLRRFTRPGRGCSATTTPPSIDSLERSRSSSTSASAGDTSESRQDRLRRQYVEGQISEAEFERRIASELETEEPDDIDRQNSNGNGREPSVTGRVSKTVPKLLAQVVEVEVLHREQHQQVVDEVCALVGEFVEVVVFRREIVSVGLLADLL